MRKLILLIAIPVFSKKLAAQDIGELGKQKWLKASGTVGVGAMFTSQHGIAARRVPFSWYINGNPTLVVKGITFPFAFIYSEQERNFTQPFNKYGVSPYYKWLTLHAGYRNIYYSDYTLAGATFLGGGFDANPGNLRIGAVYGKFRNRTLIDEANLSRYSYVVPAYERWGYAFKVGFGKGPNFTDFYVFGAKDKVDTAVMAQADAAQIKPMENLVLGLKSNYTFLKYFDANLDLAASTVTLDTRLEDSIGNETQLRTINGIIHVNRSTVPYLAGTGSLSYNRRKFRIKAEYKRVDPQYQTLGSYYINNDLKQYTLSPTFNLLRNKLMVNGSFGFRFNNLLGDQINTTKNTIGSAYLQYTPGPQFGIGLNYSNFGTNINSGQTQLNDSIIFSVVNQSYGGNIRFTKTRSNITRTIVLSGQYQNLNDNNIVTRAFTQSRSYVSSAAWTYGNGEKGINAAATINYTHVEAYNSKFSLTGPAITLRKNIKKWKLNIGTNGSFMLKFKGSEQDGNILNVGTNITWQPSKKHNFTLLGNVLFNHTSNISVYSFSEQRASVRYTYQL